ncbi:expressed unknown protein [Seminavis robusta]|uniref:Uncharacterized protein n=1 Tax=Seminavis robusta TaxID=568900 RepID=A0A9N8EP78_9STRA|nr:expressed unknown protein [Seminavis robusta]|eukprot:Sro1577_g283610.1 n/a (277) ;mRNA; r:20898-21728
MALAASSHSNRPSYSNVNLVPLRVNVVSNDHSLAIVDTLVFDRYCWPIPLYDPLEEALERNADELAYTLLSDLEVYGMGRTVRHFTNRVDLWTTGLQEKIRRQLLPQLRHVAKTTKLRIPKHIDDEEENAQKRKRQEEESATISTSSEAQPAQKSSKRKRKAALVPVRLRLCVNGVRIHDDFIWDLSVPQCPLQFAQSLGKDLNLSEEAVVAIMTSIVEQLDGSVVEDTKDLDVNSAKKNASAAWALEHRVHLTNVTQILTLHRPQQPATSTAPSR